MKSLAFKIAGIALAAGTAFAAAFAVGLITRGVPTAPAGPAKSPAPAARANPWNTLVIPGEERVVSLARALQEETARTRARQTETAERERFLSQLLAEIRHEKAAAERIRDEAARRLEALKKARAALDSKLEVIGQVENKNLKKMAQMYDKMPSESAAQILGEMVRTGEETTAIKILYLMTDRQAARVLAAITPAEQAAEITKRLRLLKKEGA
jgi:flagellar motility protein MotE (MotC chaperone)